MRRNFFGQPYAQPGDLLEELADASGGAFGTVEYADLEIDADAEYGYGGEIVDEEGETFAFDGFASREDAVKWLVENIGVPEYKINDVG